MPGGSDGVVIVGAGHGGVETSAALAGAGWPGPIHLVSDESFLPYQRPPLSKGHLANPGSPLPLKSESFYADKGIQLHLGVSAQAIDRAGRTVTLSDGRALGYQHLVLATGARNRIPVIPGLDSTAMIQLRTLGDAEAIVGRLASLKRVMVVGGGFIGLEAAGLLPKLGIEVDVVEMAPRLMQRAVSPTISQWFLRYHLDHGVRVHLSDSVRDVSSSAAHLRARLTSGHTGAADALLMAAGVIPNVELAVAAGLEVANGVVVDDHLLTSDPAISALGDCAAFPHHSTGERVRLESVQNAADQARHIAARLMGKGAPYRDVPWFWSIQGDARLQIVGLYRPGLTQVLRGNPSSGKFSVFLHDGDELVAVESVNAPGDHILARRLLARPLACDWSVVSDMAVDLRSLLATPLSQ